MDIAWQTNDACMTCLDIYSKALSGEYQWFTIKYGYAMAICGFIAGVVGVYLGMWYRGKIKR